jgi:dinuclear metal center YbgI/SA1388 family protein
LYPRPQYDCIHCMGSIALKRIVKDCNEELRIHQIEDWPGAVNGLQVENNGEITKIAAAVDGTFATAQEAVEQGADLLIVHHGLFWNKTHPWTGRKYEFMKFLMDHNLAVYSSHLPLDVHPVLGNNAQLCQALGFKKVKPFFTDKGRELGLRSGKRIQRNKLMENLESILGSSPTLLPGGPELCRHVGVVTGGAGAELAIAAREGVDTFITGEGPHWTFALAEDLGINVIYGGHYATETFGVKALAKRLSDRYKLPWTFVDHPTGL